MNDKANDRPSAEAEMPEGVELEILELEDLNVPVKWACACSTTCKCTTTSCMAWSL